MVVSLLSPAVTTSAPPDATPQKVAASPAPPDSTLPFITATDIKNQEQYYGKKNLADLEADPALKMNLSALNARRARGESDGIVPYAHLSDADVSLFERMTGTTSIMAAVTSSFDARALMGDLSMSRLNGTLTGPVTLSYLKDYLATAQQAYATFLNPGLASPAFVQKTITALEKETAI